MDTRIRIKIISVCLACSITIGAFCSCESNTASLSSDASVSCSELKISEIEPAYSSGTLRVIWDMKLWDGSLYVGAGDYDKNISPSVAMRYNLTSKKWEQCGTIPDEQINRFVDLDATIAIPGTDPTADWSMGNYYVLKEDSFKTERVLPGGIHNFDLTVFDGNTFAALGVSSGSFPVVVRKDGETAYKSVAFFDKDTSMLSTSDFTEVRAYDLFKQNGRLFALIKLDSDMFIYIYDGEAFRYHTSLSNKIVVGGFAYVPLLEKINDKDTVFITTGLLYTTDDMKNYRDITPDGIEYVTDLLNFDGAVYALGNTAENGGYLITVLKKVEGITFEAVFEVECDIPAQSFEYDGKTFYIGVGGKNKESKNSGKILCINTGE